MHLWSDQLVSTSMELESRTVSSDRLLGISEVFSTSMINLLVTVGRLVFFSILEIGTEASTKLAPSMESSRNARRPGVFIADRVQKERYFFAHLGLGVTFIYELKTRGHAK